MAGPRTSLQPIPRLSGINSRSDQVFPRWCPIEVTDYKVSIRPYNAQWHPEELAKHRRLRISGGPSGIINLSLQIPGPRAELPGPPTIEGFVATPQPVMSDLAAAHRISVFQTYCFWRTLTGWKRCRVFNVLRRGRNEGFWRGR